MLTERSKLYEVILISKVVCRYLGLFTKEVEAAQAYDNESVMRKGLKAITNFDISEYLELLSEPSTEMLNNSLQFLNLQAWPVLASVYWPFASKLLKSFASIRCVYCYSLPTTTLPMSIS